MLFTQFTMPVKYKESLFQEESDMIKVKIILNYTLKESYKLFLTLYDLFWPVLLKKYV